MDRLKSITPGDVLKQVEILRIGEEASDFIVSVENFNKLKEEVEKNNQEAKKARDEAVIPVLKERWPNLIETKSGIYFTIVRQGTGRTPVNGTRVTVKYTGTLVDGTVFMDTAKDGGTKKLIIGEVIKGLNEALLTMRKEERRIVVIPPEMGFGKAGLEPLIPPDSFLIFDVELIDF
jgi:peptidylprolyl isomerase